MKTVLRLHLVIVALCLSLSSAFHVQNVVAQEAKWTSSNFNHLNYLNWQAFRRTNEDRLRTILRKGGDKKHENVYAFLRAYHSGDWATVSATVAGFPKHEQEKFYHRVVRALDEERTRQTLLLSDIVAVIDLNFNKYDNSHTDRLGRIIKESVAKEEQEQFVALLKAESKNVGGSDPSKNAIAATILSKAGMVKAALALFPREEDLEAIGDVSLKNSLKKLLDQKTDASAGPTKKDMADWEQARTALETTSNKSRETYSKVVYSLGLIPEALVIDWVKNYCSTKEIAIELLANAGMAVDHKIRHYHNKDRYEMRTAMLKSQSRLVNAISKAYDLSDMDFRVVLEVITANWIYEAKFAAGRYMEYHRRNRPQHLRFVEPFVIATNAPTGAWYSALNVAIKKSVDLNLAKVYATTDFNQKAVDSIVKLATDQPKQAEGVANFYIQIWAQKNNPNLSNEIRNRYRVRDKSARITLTRRIQSRNLRQLSQVLKGLRDAGIPFSDYESLVSAYDTSSSRAETYASKDIEALFGSVKDMPQAFLSHILSTMRTNLAKRWRSVKVQQGARTNRNSRAICRLVDDGYQSAISMGKAHVAANPSSWEVGALIGSLAMDRSDFLFSQSLVDKDGGALLTTSHNSYMDGIKSFATAAAAYRQNPPQSKREFSTMVYSSWIEGLIGMGPEGLINVHRAVDPATLEKIAAEIDMLPGSLAKEHKKILAKATEKRFSKSKPPLSPEMKFKYLTSMLAVTGDNPFASRSKKAVDYYRELLSELSLHSYVDGPAVVGAQQEFGVIISVHHTVDMGREANLGKLLANEKKKNNTVLGKVASKRDMLEKSIQEQLLGYAEILSINFSDSQILPRDLSKPGWQETPIAYMRLKISDPSVDRIPPFELELEFMGPQGPVSLPIASDAIVLDVRKESVAPRPVGNLKISQVLDNREIKNGRLTLEVSAESSGIINDLSEVIDVSGLDIGEDGIAPVTQTRVLEITTVDGKVNAETVRSWIIDLSADALSGAVDSFTFPRPVMADAAVEYKTFDDQDLVDVPGGVYDVKAHSSEEVAADEQGSALYYLLIIPVLIAMFVVYIMRGSCEDEEQSEEIAIPENPDAFQTIKILQQFAEQKVLSEQQAAEIRDQVTEIEQSAFSSSAAADVGGFVEKISTWQKLPNKEIK